MLGANGFFNRVVPSPDQLGVTMGFTSLPSWPQDRWFRAGARVVPPLGQLGEIAGRRSLRPLPLVPSGPPSGIARPPCENRVLPLHY
jgi:hypothetical protein